MCQYMDFLYPYYICIHRNDKTYVIIFSDIFYCLVGIILLLWIWIHMVIIQWAIFNFNSIEHALAMGCFTKSKALYIWIYYFRLWCLYWYIIDIKIWKNQLGNLSGFCSWLKLYIVVLYMLLKIYPRIISHHMC